MVTLLSAMIEARFWFEYIESESNWSDGLSRKLEADEWVREHAFTLRRETVPSWPWQLELEQLPSRLEAEMRAALEQERSSGGELLA